MSKTTWSNGQTTQDPHVINFIPLSITFQSPDWGFPPSSPISFLRIERSKVKLLDSKRIQAECSGEWQARATRGCRWEKPSSLAGAGKQLGKSHFLLWSCLCSAVTPKAALQLGRYELWAVEWLQSWKWELCWVCPVQHRKRSLQINLFLPWWFI